MVPLALIARSGTLRFVVKVASVRPIRLPASNEGMARPRATVCVMGCAGR
jgi:hypothetical protein